MQSIVNGDRMTNRVQQIVGVFPATTIALKIECSNSLLEAPW